MTSERFDPLRFSKPRRRRLKFPSKRVHRESAFSTPWPAAQFSEPQQGRISRAASSRVKLFQRGSTSLTHSLHRPQFLKKLGDKIAMPRWIDIERVERISSMGRISIDAIFLALRVNAGSHSPFR